MSNYLYVTAEGCFPSTRIVTMYRIRDPRVRSTLVVDLSLVIAMVPKGGFEPHGFPHHPLKPLPPYKIP